MLAALVGVDFGGGGVPTNWTQVTTVGTTGAPTVQVNLRDETNGVTPIDLQIGNSSGLIADNADAAINASTLPQHTQSLAGLNNLVFVDGPALNNFNASFSDLKPGFTYELYVFALEDVANGFMDKQTVTISGGSPNVVFAQNPVSANNLWVNDQIGSSSQPLANYRKLMTPNASSQINVAVQMTGGSDALVLAGLAIREVGLVVNNAGGGDDNLPGNGVMTLREAVRLANNSAGADVITFAANMSGATIQLGGAELAITEALTIDAAPLAANVTIDALQQSRVVNITATSGDVTLAGLTITGGKTTQDSGFDDLHSGGGVRSVTSGLLTLSESKVSDNGTTGGFAYGGGIYAAGGVSLLHSTVDGNSTTGRAAFGGGVYANGAVSLLQSTVSGNSTAGENASGGGIWANGGASITRSAVTGNRTEGMAAQGGGLSTGAATLLKSTVSGNSTAGVNAHGGGVLALSAILTESTVSGNSASGVNANGGGMRANLFFVTGSTIAGNSAAGAGGGVYQDGVGPGVELSLSDTIVSGNTSGAGSPDLNFSSGAPLVINHSLIGDTTGSGITIASGTGNLLNVNPLLGPLADNGGPTLPDGSTIKTHALLPSSPALDAGATPAVVYRFEEGAGASTTANLISIFGANLVGGVTMGQDGAPLVGGNAATFDGVDDYMRKPSSLDLSAANRYSVELWFNATTVGTDQSLVALTDGAGGHAVLVELSANGALRFLNRIPAGNTGGDNLASAPGAVAANQWYHLAAVRDGAKMWIYLNGVQVATLASATTANLPANLLLTAGRLSETQSDRYFGGKLDELAVHTRALTPGEVALHAQAGFVDQRGRFGFGEGNGEAFPLPDMGAYEAQVKTSADFDADFAVDGADLLAWQRGLGAPNATRAQGNSDDDADADHSDLAAWRVQFGATNVFNFGEAAATPSGASAVVSSSVAPLDAAHAALSAPGNFTQFFAAPDERRPVGRDRWRRGR